MLGFDVKENIFKPNPIQIKGDQCSGRIHMCKMIFVSKLISQLGNGISWNLLTGFKICQVSAWI